MITLPTNYNEVKELFASIGHRIGFCKFTKRDGSERSMYFQGKIHESNFHGGAAKYNIAEKRIVLVRDIKLPTKKCIRAIRIDSILSLSFNGMKYVGA